MVGEFLPNIKVHQNNHIYIYLTAICWIIMIFQTQFYVLRIHQKTKQWPLPSANSVLNVTIISFSTLSNLMGDYIISSIPQLRKLRLNQIKNLVKASLVFKFGLLHIRLWTFSHHTIQISWKMSLSLSIDNKDIHFKSCLVYYVRGKKNKSFKNV
jgi:hypothetical protein